MVKSCQTAEHHRRRLSRHHAAPFRHTRVTCLTTEVMIAAITPVVACCRPALHRSTPRQAPNPHEEDRAIAAGPRSRRLRSDRSADELERRIEDGRLPSGPQLPSEPELAAELSVSRATVREALQALRGRGLSAGAGAPGRSWPPGADGQQPGSELRRLRGDPRSGHAARHRLVRRVGPATANEAARLSVSRAGTCSSSTGSGRRTASRSWSRATSSSEMVGESEEVVDRMLHESIYELVSPSSGSPSTTGSPSFGRSRADSALRSGSASRAESSWSTSGRSTTRATERPCSCPTNTTWLTRSTSP